MVNGDDFVAPAVVVVMVVVIVDWGRRGGFGDGW
jgi:hypothetical protein